MGEATLGASVVSLSAQWHTKHLDATLPNARVNRLNRVFEIRRGRHAGIGEQQAIFHSPNIGVGGCDCHQQPHISTMLPSSADQH